MDKLLDYSINNKIRSNYFFCYKIFTLNAGNNKIIKIKSNKVKVFFNIDLINNIEIIKTKYYRFFVFKPFLDNDENKEFFEKYKESADKSYQYLELLFGFMPSMYDKLISVYLLPDIAFSYTSGGVKGIYISIAQLMPKEYDQSISFKIHDKYFTFSHELTHYFLNEFDKQPAWMVENFADYFAIKCEYSKFSINENIIDWVWINNHAIKFDKKNLNFVDYDIFNRNQNKDSYILTILKELEELVGNEIWAKTFKSMKTDNYKFYKYLSPSYDDNKKTKEFINYIQRNTDKDIISFFKDKGFKY